MLNLREVRAVGLGAVIVATYMALVLMTGRVDPGMFGRLFSFYVGISIAIWVFLGGLCLFGLLIHHGRKSGREPFLADFLANLARERWERDRFVSAFWPPLLFASLLASFNAFKQMVLPLAGFSWDPLLAAADKALFMGVDPWRVSHALLGPQATVVIDSVYHGWFVPMSLGLILCAWMPASTFRLRTQYMLSYIAIWIGIGSIGAWLMPSAGPCFYETYVGSQASFHELLQRLAQVQADTGVALTSLPTQDMLRQLHGADKLAIGGGISAMPSVHNALAMLFALAAFRLHKGAGWIFGGYAALIWIGSIHLGWHYALDGLLAFVLTWVIWLAAGRLAASLDRSEPAPEPAAVLA
jgi:PAP2 superfamily protein